MNTYYVYNTEMKLLATVEANKFHLDNGGACFYKGTAPVSSLCAYVPKPCIILTEPNEVKFEGKSKMKIFKVTNRGTGLTQYIAGHDIKREPNETFILFNGIANISYSDTYYVEEFKE
jgi:hypothetical protein